VVGMEVPSNLRWYPGVHSGSRPAHIPYETRRPRKLSLYRGVDYL